MRFGLFIVLGWICGWSHASGEEQLPSLKVGGDFYSNVTVTAVSATDIYFNCDCGMTRAKLEDLDPGWQLHFQTPSQPAWRIEPVPAAQSGASNAVAVSVTKVGTGKFLNRPVPALVVAKWLTREPDRSGKFVLLDFWATWCSPCRQAIAGLNGLQQKFGDRVVIIGLSDEKEAVVRRLVAPKIDYSLAIDPAARLKQAMGVAKLPHVVMVDPHGIVRWEGDELKENDVADILARYPQ